MQQTTEKRVYVARTKTDDDGQPVINDDAAEAIVRMALAILEYQREPLLEMTEKLCAEHGAPDSAHVPIWEAFLAGLECALTGMALGCVNVEHIVVE